MQKNTPIPRKNHVPRRKKGEPDFVVAHRNMVKRIAELDAEYLRMQEQLRKIVNAAKNRHRDD